MAKYIHKEVPGSPPTPWYLAAGAVALAGSTSTHCIAKNQDGSLTHYFGTGFSYDSLGLFKSGTVTSLSRTNSTSTKTFETLTGVSVSAKALVHAGSADASNALLFKGNDTLTGWSKADLLGGFGGNDKIDGKGGNDYLVGGDGKDTLLGGVGNDKLYGGNGLDKMTGGKGDDDFIFGTPLETGKTQATADRIMDFVHGHDDIDLRLIDANGKPDGDTKFKFIAKMGQVFSADHKGGELHWNQINSTNNALDRTIVEGDINGDGKADFTIVLQGLIKLTAGDFLL